MSEDGSTGSAHRIRCTFVAFRGVDALFTRSVHVVDVPRVGERVHLWFEGAANVRGVVRDVRWLVPESGEITVNVQVELSEVDRRRFARRGPIPDASLPTEES